jgi:hypothetical protein
MLTVRRVTPVWIKPQLAALVKQAPDGPGWFARNQARRLPYARSAASLRGAERSARRPLSENHYATRQGLDRQVPNNAKTLLTLPTKSAYLDGDLCGVLPDGRTAFNLIQNDHGDASLIYLLFDLLFLDAEDLTGLSLVDRKTPLEAFRAGSFDFF